MKDILSSFSLLPVESPQQLLKDGSLFIQSQKEKIKLSQNLVYFQAPYERAQPFGVSLWAYAYGECQHLWQEEIQDKTICYFPFILEVQENYGLIFLGLRLGLKYFSSSGDQETLRRLHDIAQNHGGAVFKI